MKIKLIDVGDGLPLLILDINKERRSEIRRIVYKHITDFELIGFMDELKEEDAAKCVHCYGDGCFTEYMNRFKGVENILTINSLSSLKSKLIAGGIVFENPFIVLLTKN